MTVYDYLTPFEEHLSRELPLPHSDMEVQATKSSTSIDTPGFDVGPPFFTPPQPFTILPLTSEPPSSYEKVPELSHRISTHSSSSDVSSASSPCKSCGLIPVDKGLLPEHDCCHICPDIARERECPDIHVPSEIEESQAQDRRPSGHHRRRHSLLNECAPPIPRDDLDTPEEQSNPLEYEASPLGQAADAPEKLDGAVSPCSTDTREQQSEVKARQEEWERQLLKDNAGLSPPHTYGNQSSFYGKCL